MRIAADAQAMGMCTLPVLDVPLCPKFDHSMSLRSSACLPMVGSGEFQIRVFQGSALGREGERDEAALMKDPSYVLVLAVEDVNDPIDHLGPEPTCGNLMEETMVLGRGDDDT